MLRHSWLELLYSVDPLVPVHVRVGVTTCKLSLLRPVGPTACVPDRQVARRRRSVGMKSQTPA